MDSNRTLKLSDLQLDEITSEDEDQISSNNDILSRSNENVELSGQRFREVHYHRFPVGMRSFMNGFCIFKSSLPTLFSRPGSMQLIYSKPPPNLYYSNFESIHSDLTHNFTDNTEREHLVVVGQKKLTYFISCNGYWNVLVANLNLLEDMESCLCANVFEVYNSNTSKNNLVFVIATHTKPSKNAQEKDKGVCKLYVLGIDDLPKVDTNSIHQVYDGVKHERHEKPTAELNSDNNDNPCKVDDKQSNEGMLGNEEGIYQDKNNSDHKEILQSNGDENKESHSGSKNPSKRSNINQWFFLEQRLFSAGVDNSSKCIDMDYIPFEISNYVPSSLCNNESSTDEHKNQEYPEIYISGSDKKVHSYVLGSNGVFQIDPSVFDINENTLKEDIDSKNFIDKSKKTDENNDIQGVITNGVNDKAKDSTEFPYNPLYLNLVGPNDMIKTLDSDLRAIRSFSNMADALENATNTKDDMRNGKRPSVGYKGKSEIINNGGDSGHRGKDSRDNDVEEVHCSVWVTKSVSEFNGMKVSLEMDKSYTLNLNVKKRNVLYKKTDINEDHEGEKGKQDISENDGSDEDDSIDDLQKFDYPAINLLVFGFASRQKKYKTFPTRVGAVLSFAENPVIVYHDITFVGLDTEQIEIPKNSPIFKRSFENINDIKLEDIDDEYKALIYPSPSEKDKAKRNVNNGIDHFVRGGVCVLPRSNEDGLVTTVFAADMDYDGVCELIIGTNNGAISIYKLVSDVEGREGYALVYRKLFKSPVYFVCTLDLNMDGLNELIVVTLLGVHILQPNLSFARQKLLERLECNIKS
ncbi:hypothetical protein BB559_004631 [Furculomyces boomerangus]|uniref:Kaptin n=1 Tax=Furculomyces boomerangus TaxID=61424 RepID=A0A2T9YDK8_9FUNG|nr:hypothetical protein BB559_004631 [Furculomyces boomerangus]